MSKARAKKVKLLVLDVDGVMTDGTIFLFPSMPGSQKGGSASDTVVEAKGFNAHDGTAMSLARLGGIKIGLITKRQSETVRLRARDLKIEHVYQEADNKLACFREMLQKENLTADQAAYVGDDLVDLPVMRQVGLAIAVANAREDVKDESHVITDHRGGDGAVRDAVEYILKAQGTYDKCVNSYISSLTPAEKKQQ